MSQYREGTCFAVPLRDGDFALGVVARANTVDGVLLLYLFGPRRNDVDIEEIRTLEPRVALKIVRAGDLALVNGTWRVLGEIPGWTRSAWPVPTFHRTEEPGGRTWVLEYADDDPNRVVREQRSDDSRGKGERDALYGAGAVELLLTHLLPKTLH